MAFYRWGAPGEDSVAHIRFDRRGGPARCVLPRFPEDDPKVGNLCARMSVALCDGPGCDRPICELHRTKHATKPDTDFCPDHKGLA